MPISELAERSVVDVLKELWSAERVKAQILFAGADSLQIVHEMRFGMYDQSLPI